MTRCDKKLSRFKAANTPSGTSSAKRISTATAASFKVARRRPAISAETLRPWRS
jgi:hypothetical protein